ncbi:MAG: nucleotidyltransferase domain-containing protein [Magnetococcales bacterium]|nr:nucleotidyltransferase domain-containing protein [Magnetococcales bacterium]NGZ28063.1 nucleotidyltransferase domain-containing protein [Magnetococcales bacterium]
MKQTGLTAEQLAMMTGVFRRYDMVRQVILYGSRAKGNFRPSSDVDLVLVGGRDELLAQRIAEELESLPLPYQFDVRWLDTVSHPPLLAHIHRVGILLYALEETVGLG